MKKKELQIHTDNILPIIKKWLYTDRDIFIRELVSNACDAIHKLQTISKQNAESSEKNQEGNSSPKEEFRIDIKIDQENKAITVRDNGIGMTEEEIEKYIAQVAFSGAEEFVKKYSSSSEEDQVIGHFGLGFYSAFMVADRVTIHSLSHRKGEKAAFWSCDGSSNYEIGESQFSSRGTEITLFLGKKYTEFLEKSHTEEVLKRYCSFLSYPIFFEETRINPQQPLWIKPAKECEDKEYKEFYRGLYPMDTEPLFWIHLNVDYPFHLKGILYFPKISPFFNKNRGQIKLYCNRVFVSEHCENVIPEYLMMLRGAIDSPDIPLNVSRSSLQLDNTVRQLSSHISKKVSDRLIHLFQSDRKKFIDVWSDVETVAKVGAMQEDSFFDRIHKCIIWKNSAKEWSTIEEYLERNKEKHENKVYYSSEDQVHSKYFSMYSEKGIEILFMGTVLDNAFINHMEKKNSSITFQRIDGGIDDTLIDKKREKTLLDAEGKTIATRIADLFRSHLKKDQLDIEAKSLSSDELPALVIFDEKSRRFRDYMAAMSPSSSENMGQEMIGKHTLVLNTNNPLITSLHSLGEKNSSLAQEVVNEIYELALISQKEMKEEKLQEFISRTHRVLQLLTSEMAKKTTILQ